MIATKRRKLVGRSRSSTKASAGATSRRTVGLKAYLVSIEGNGIAAVYAVACKADDDPIETVNAVQGFTGHPSLAFEVIPAEGLCVHLAGDVPVKGTQP